MADETVTYLIRFKGDSSDVVRAIRDTRSGIKELGGVTSSMRKVTDEHEKANRRLEHSFTELAKRAVLVIPVWMAIRGTYSALLGTINGGFSDWVKYEEELLRVKNVSREFGKETDQVMGLLSGKIKQMSIDTGKSMSELAFSFYRFKTIGKTYEESLGGMDAVTKATIAFQGEQREVAEFLSTSYNLLGKTITEVESPADKMNLMMAKLNKLYTTNDFLIAEMVESMKKFLPVAQSMNLSYDQTISLLGALHTGAIKAGRSGTLLSTSFQQLMSNLSEVAQIMGLYLDPKNTPFEQLLIVMTELERLQKSGNLKKVEQSLDKIFGGVRGSMPIRDLITGVFPVLMENLKTTSTDAGKLMKEYTENIKSNMESIPRQIDRFKNLRNLIGQSFVQGVTGGKDFEDSLVKINDIMEKLQSPFQRFGELVKGIADTFIAIKNTIDYIANYTNLGKNIQQYGNSAGLLYTSYQMGNKIGKRIMSVNPEKEIIYEGFANKFTQQQKAIVQGQASAFEWKSQEQLALESGQASPFSWGKNPQTISRPKEVSYELTEDFKTKLRLLDKELNYVNMQAEGYNEIAITQARLNDYVKENVTQANKVFETSKGQRSLLDDQTVLTMALNKNWQGIANSFSQAFTDEDIEKKIQTIAEFTNKIAQEQSKLVIQRRNEKLELLSIIALDQNEIKYIAMRISGYNSIQIAQQKLIDYVREEVKIQNQLAKDSNGRIKSLSEEEIILMAQNGQWDKLIDKFQDANVSTNKLLAINTKLNDIYKERLNIIAEYSESLRSEVQGNLTDVLMGEQTGQQALDKLSNFTKRSFFDSISGQISDIAISKTGLGAMFGGIMSELRYGDNPLSKGIVDGCQAGGQILYQYITSAMTGSAIPGVGLPSPVAGILQQGGFSPFNIGALGGNGQNWKTNPQFVNAPANGLLTTGASQAGILSGLTLGNLAGGAVLGGLTGLSMYNQAKVSGASNGTSLASGIMSGIGFGGIGALTASGVGLGALMSNPVGWVLGGLALGGMALGLFGKKKKSTTTDIQNQIQIEQQQVASKIDITNKQLEIVNRNLVALRQTITYILPSSAYTAEKTNIEDQFSLNKRRGV